MDPYVGFGTAVLMAFVVMKSYDVYRFRKGIRKIQENGELDDEARVEAMVFYMGDKGYRVENKGKTKIQFAKKKRFNWLISVIFLIVGVFLWPVLLLFVIHIIIHLASKEQLMLVSLKPAKA